MSVDSPGWLPEGRAARPGSIPESESVQAGLYLGAGHEEAPEQAGAMVFHHDHDGALIDGEVPGFAPPVMKAEAVVEAIGAVNPMTEVVVEMAEGSQAFLGVYGKDDKAAVGEITPGLRPGGVPRKTPPSIQRSIPSTGSHSRGSCAGCRCSAAG